ncbi:MAG: hypothetical protein QM750_26490 [Rubrivivax sp.]
MKNRSPLFWAALAGLAVLVAAFVPVGWRMLQPPPPAAGVARELPAPWQVQSDGAGGVRAFGLRLPQATLADAAAIWGDDLLIGLIASGPGREAALEAYTDRWSGGGITGKLVLAAEVPPALLQQWRARSPKREVFEGGSQRWHLHADDREAALRSPVAGLSFVPSRRLDADTLQSRFGPPAQILAGTDGTRHWLYPDRGLAIAQDEGSGRTVLQVVAPPEFERRLRAPLLLPAAASAASLPP